MAELIPTGILNNIIQCNNAYHKKSYIANLEENNHEEDFQVAIDIAELDKLSGLAQNTINGCV